MTALGARDRTAEEMRDTLHQPAVDELHAITGGLAAGLQTPSIYELRFLNTLWLQTGVKVSPDFAAALRKDYQTAATEVNFAGDADAACKTINGAGDETAREHRATWPRRKRSPPARGPRLTSVAYLRAAWATPFLKDLTRAEEFAVSPGKRLRVPMMRQTAALPYVNATKYQAVEMPYVGNRLSMLVLLPKPGITLAEVEKSLTPDQLTDLAGALATQKVFLRLPRFSIGAPLNLAGALQKMGMQTAFTVDANFSGIDGGRTIVLGPVLHEAAIAVDEDGSDAPTPAALGAPKALSTDKAAEFVADHPFLVLIVERASRTILFMGRVVEPA